MREVQEGMVGFLVTDYGKMLVPNGLVFPDENLHKREFSMWIEHQTRRAFHAWRVGRSLPSANDGGW